LALKIGTIHPTGNSVFAYTLPPEYYKAEEKKMGGKLETEKLGKRETWGKLYRMGGLNNSSKPGLQPKWGGPLR